MRNLDNWEIADVAGDTFTLWLCVSSDTGKRLVFVVTGATIETDEDGTSGVFKAFTIDGREPTDEEADTYSDDLRALIRDVYSDT